MIPDSDGTPVSAIEAMLAHKPVILGDRPSYDTDLFNDSTVWKTSCSDANQIADKITEVLNLPAESLNKKLQTAYETALQYADFEKEMSKVEKLYRLMSVQPL
jgi:glycosyltransferase involved in cell wall biosynthesis